MWQKIVNKKKEANAKKSRLHLQLLQGFLLFPFYFL